MFEMETNSNTMSSAVEGRVERVQFTIDNVLIGDAIGQIPAPNSVNDIQFVVKIYRLQRTDPGDPWPAITQRYFNNRIGDFTMKTGTQGACPALSLSSINYTYCWFDGTAIDKYFVVSNSLDDPSWIRPVAALSPSYTNQNNVTLSVTFMVRTSILGLTADRLSDPAPNITIMVPRGGFQTSTGSRVTIYNMTSKPSTNITLPTLVPTYSGVSGFPGFNITIIVPVTIAKYTTLMVQISGLTTPVATPSGGLARTLTGDFRIITKGSDG